MHVPLSLRGAKQRDNLVHRLINLTPPISARQPRRMADTELPITGYLDRFSHRPGESIHRPCQPTRWRIVPRPPGARAERRSQSRWSRHALRGSVASLRSVVRRTPSADPPRVVRRRRRRPGARYKWQPAPGPCWCKPGLADAGQVAAGGGSRRCRHHAADRRKRRDGAHQVAGRHDRTGDRNADAARHAGTASGSPPIRPIGRILVGQQSLDGERRSRHRHPHPASPCHRAARVLIAAENADSPTTPFHRQVGGPRDPARLRRIMARCRRTTRCASRRPAGRLGLLPRHRHTGNKRHRSSGVPRQSGEHADTRHGRHALDRPRAVLASRAARLRRNPFPRRRSGRLWLAGGFLLDRAGRSAQRCLCAASDLRCRRGLAAAIRAAAPSGAVRTDRVPGLDLHLSGLRQPRAQQRRSRILRARRGMGRLSLQSARLSDLRTLDL